MAELLGNDFLPDAVSSRRVKLREQVQSLREPVRQFRRSNIPGPNVVDSVESQMTDLRSKVVSRDSVVSGITDRRSDDANDSGSELSREGRNKAESMV